MLLSVSAIHTIIVATDRVHDVIVDISLSVNRWQRIATVLCLQVFDSVDLQRLFQGNGAIVDLSAIWPCSSHESGGVLDLISR